MISTNPPTLLVPVALEALIVNNAVTATVPFSRWSPVYENLNQFKSPIPAPFNNQGGSPAHGVYLHWVLPDTFAHGIKQPPPASPQPGTAAAIRAAAGLPDQEEIIYPHVPNRWLVVRIVPGTATTTGTCKAWVIQSDYYDPNNGGSGSNPYPNPFPSDPNSIEATTLGKTVDLESWVESTAVQMFLKAVGPANVTFSAYTPNVTDVFSVYDDLSDVTGSSADLSYVVMGWYSDPTADLLYGSQYGPSGWTTAAQWQDLMQTLNWAMPAGADQLPAASLPKQSLCHGLISTVQWQTQSAPNRVNSDPTKLRVAVGNKGIDAFVALLEAAQNPNSPINPELMEAFQYNLLNELDQPDGSAQVDVRTEQAWFASTPGGTLWQIVAAQRADLTQTNQPQPQPTPTQLAALAALNQAQAQLDRTRRQLQSRQSQLHDAWWKQQFITKNNYNAPNSPPERGLAGNWQPILDALSAALNPSNPQSLISQVNQLQSSVTTQATALPDPQNPQSISTYATTVLKLPATFELIPVAQPRFYQPSDPVLMIGGMEWPDRYLYGGVSDPTAPLLTRFGDHTITGLTVSGQTLTTSQIGAAMPMLSAQGQAKLPSNLLSCMIAVLQEAFWMDPGNAAVIAAHLNGVTPAAVAAAISAYGNSPSTAPVINQQPPANVPAQLAVTSWQQAWSPLYLEWQITWQPTTGTSSTPGLVNWTFDGSDYQWTGGSPSSQQEQTYSSRIFLSPHITMGFIARLKRYLQDNPNSPDAPGLQAIAGLIDQIGDWNFLSQALSGFNDFLIMQDLDVTMPPDTSVLPQIDSQYDSFPYTAPGATSGSGWDPPPTPANYFFPVRAGHFYFRQLQVVDRFGQVLNLLQANTNPSGNYQSFYPIRGTGLVPDSGNTLSYPQCLLKQPPRLVQPSRLELNFVSATNDQQPSNLFANANPVCGWVLPNHLDQGLGIYDATGKLLGELLLIATSQGPTLIWQPDPGNPAPVLPADIANPHLKGFVQQLLSLNDQGQGFQAFLQVIDATLWTIDPIGGRGDQNLSVLIGRPLALVRASLQLILEGDPVQDQAWVQTCGVNPLGETTFDFTQVQFNVRLGRADLLNDGVLGYFNGDNYQQFNSVHPPSGSTPYIAPISPSNCITLPPNYLGQSSPTVQWVTLLLDPRGSIHATTGILPTQQVTLPDDYIGDAIKTLNVTFRVSGLLTDAETIRIPIPAAQQADWSWIERSDPQTWNTSLPIVKANQKPRLASLPPVIHEGWLKLVERED